MATNTAVRRAAGVLHEVAGRLAAAWGQLNWEARWQSTVDDRVATARGQVQALARTAEALAGYLLRKARDFDAADRAGAQGLDGSYGAYLHGELVAAKHTWHQARLRGDQAGMAAAHQRAEALRALGATVSEDENQAINARYEAEPASASPSLSSVPPAAPPSTVDLAAYRAATRPQRFGMLKPFFLATEQETGVPWQVQAAQWALETGWGDALPADIETGRESLNLFGIKGTGPAGSVTAWTSENINGEWVRVQGRFRAYHSLEESILDHAQLLTAPRYAAAYGRGSDLHGWVQELQKAGYATDPEYATKLWSIITDHGWDR